MIPDDPDVGNTRDFEAAIVTMLSEVKEDIIGMK